MAYAVENLEKLKRRITVTIPLEELNAEVQKRLRVRAKTARAAGFRPGKVPMKMVSQMYGAQINADVINDKVNKGYEEAVAENKLRIVGIGSIDAKKDDVPEGMLQFYVSFEVFPDVEIAPLADLEVEKASCEVSDADVENTINILRRRVAEYEEKPADGVAEEGDRVTVDYTGLIDGAAFEGGKADGIVVILGEKRMLPEFEGALAGMKVGETKSFDLPFPENYHGKDVAGKTAQFTVTVQKIELAKLPELDDEFCKKLGVEEGGAEKLREEIKKNLLSEVKKRIGALNKSHVFEQFVKANPFDIPQALIEQEIDSLIDYTRGDLAARNPEHKDDELPRSMFTKQAENRVRLSLLLGELLKDNVLAVSQEELKARAEEIASTYQQPQMVVDYYMNDTTRRRELENILMDEKAVEYIYSKAKVTDKALPFEEVIVQTY